MTKLHTVADVCTCTLYHIAETATQLLVVLLHTQKAHTRPQMDVPTTQEGNSRVESTHTAVDLSTQDTAAHSCQGEDPHRSQSTQDHIHTGCWDTQSPDGSLALQTLLRSLHNGHTAQSTTPWLSGIAHRLPGQHSHRVEWTNHTGDISCHTEHFSIHTVSLAAAHGQ